MLKKILSIRCLRILKCVQGFSLVPGFTWKDERRDKRIQLGAHAKKRLRRERLTRPPISREILILKERQQTQHSAQLQRNVFCSISCLLFFLQQRTHGPTEGWTKCDAGGRAADFFFYLPTLCGFVIKTLCHNNVDKCRVVERASFC